jgi:hypothetical protein
VVARPAQAQLAGPAQVKIYKTSVQKSLMNLHEYTTNLEFTQKVQTYHSVRNIHLRRIPLSFGDLSAVVAIIAAAAAAARAVFAGLARTLARGRSFGRRGDAFSVLFFPQL